MDNFHKDSRCAYAKFYTQMSPIFLSSICKKLKFLEQMWTMKSFPSYFYTCSCCCSGTNAWDQFKHIWSHRSPAGFRLCLVPWFGANLFHVCDCFHFWNCHGMKSVEHFFLMLWYLKTKYFLMSDYALRNIVQEVCMLLSIKVIKENKTYNKMVHSVFRGIWKTCLLTFVIHKTIISY